MNSFGEVILVNENDQPLGIMDKLEAHKKGLLHRAFSILVFNEKAELLIHKRADHKYHSAGLWTNTCCSHPQPNQETIDAAHIRLQEEMGFDCPLEHRFQFIYTAELDNHLTENELDHVFVGIFEGIPQLNPAEVSAYKWISIPALKHEIEKYPDHFTVWFRLIFQEHFHKLNINEAVTA